MQIKQLHFRQLPTAAALAPLQNIDPTLVFVFGGSRYFADGTLGTMLRGAFPQATIAGCSTAGEIAGASVYDDTLVLTAAAMPGGSITTATAAIETLSASVMAGEKLGAALRRGNPENVFVLSPGVAVNGSGLVEGLQKSLGKETTVTGGLAGDGVAFKQTYTLLNEKVYTDHAVALGFATGALQAGYGSRGGWHPFGPERTVTRVEGNVLYELDGRPALQLYKEYLGSKAQGLPGSGLLYPLAVTTSASEKIDIIRTILNVDEAQGSLILAGSLDNHSTVRLMHAKTDALVEGARRASEDAGEGRPGDKSLAILISCVGRKLVMGDDVDDEVAAVQETLGDGCVLAGFYSYGEIAPSRQGHDQTAYLHNQTMTITQFRDAQ